MLQLIFNKDDSFFFEKKLASSRGAPQENDAKFRFAIHPQGIRQFHDNCKIAKCQTVATLAPVYIEPYNKSKKCVLYSGVSKISFRGGGGGG